MFFFITPLDDRQANQAGGKESHENTAQILLLYDLLLPYLTFIFHTQTTASCFAYLQKGQTLCP